MTWWYFPCGNRNAFNGNTFSSYSKPWGLNPNSGKEMQSNIHPGTLMDKNTNSTATKSERQDPRSLEG